jgi:hypothetical protein
VLVFVFRAHSVPKRVTDSTLIYKTVNLSPFLSPLLGKLIEVSLILIDLRVLIIP